MWQLATIDQVNSQGLKFIEDVQLGGCNQLSFMQSIGWLEFISHVDNNTIFLIYKNKYIIPFQTIQTNFGSFFWARHVFPFSFLTQPSNFRRLASFLKTRKKMFKALNIIGFRLHIRKRCDTSQNMCNNGTRWLFPIKTFGGWHIAPVHELDFERTIQIKLSQGYKPSNIVKRSVKKAHRSDISVHVGLGTIDELKTFYRFYKNTASHKGFVPWPFEYLSKQFIYLNKTKQAYIFWVLEKRKKVYAAIYYTDPLKKIAFYVHGAGVHVSANIPIGYVVHDYAIKFFQSRNFNYVDLGGVGTNNPKHPLFKNSIIKRRFGGNEVRFWHAIDLPLNYKWYLYGMNTYVKNLYKGWYN